VVRISLTIEDGVRR